jgi:hypothetical protein
VRRFARNIDPGSQTHSTVLDPHSRGFYSNPDITYCPLHPPTHIALFPTRHHLFSNLSKNSNIKQFTSSGFSSCGHCPAPSNPTILSTTRPQVLPRLSTLLLGVHESSFTYTTHTRRSIGKFPPPSCCLGSGPVE